MLLVLDLIGAAALIAALTFGIISIRKFFQQMKQIDN
jgi:hypothetical protein